MAEKKTEKDTELAADSPPPGPPAYDTAGDDFVHEGSAEGQKALPFWTRMGCTAESFKRRTKADKHNQLNMTLRSRHLHMIAIGGSIGAGFFVGSGGALNRGGPASLLICFAIIGVMMFNVVFALGELAIMYPVSGGFYTYSTRFIDPSWGFAMGWNYVFQWAIVLPLELGVAAMTVQYWDETTSIAVWITIFMVAIIVINVFGILGYGEEEFWASLLKLTATVIFMIIALICVCGGGPATTKLHSDEPSPFSSYHGAVYWYDPGAFANGFRGFCSVFVTAAFAFAGTELVGLAAAESRTPLQSLPSAVKQVFWRITLFYILGLFFVGLMVPYNHERLMGAAATYTDASPFVIAAVEAGLEGFDSFMNVIILVSVLSIGISAVYGGSRCLTALAEQGYAPKVFTYVDRAGRPLWSTLILIAFGPLAYINLSADGATVFDWLLALSALAALFTWGSVCVAHIRFRHAWTYHGHTLDEIPFHAFFGVGGSWVGLALCIIVLAAQFYVAICPVGGGYNNAEGFFKQMAAIPVVILFWVVGYFWKHEGWLFTRQIDVDSGRRPIDWEAHHREKERRRNSGFFMRMVYKLF